MIPASRRPVVALIAACLPWFILAPAQADSPPVEPAAPVDPAPRSEPEWTQEKEEARVAESVQGIPSIGKKPIRDVLRFSIDGGYLQVTTPLTDLTDRRQVQVDGLPGVSTVNVITLSSSGPDPVRFPQFNNWQVTPAMSALIDVLSGAGGQLTVAHTMEGPLGMRQVELLQSPNTDVDKSVRLRVKTENTFLPELAPEDVDVYAANWTEFVRAHPRACALHLRPLFRTLGAEDDVFVIDPNEAWQVLADDWVETPAQREQVTALLARIETEDFRGRNAVVKELQSLGTPAAMILRRLDRTKLSPEQASSVDTVLRAGLPLSADLADAMSKDVNYLKGLLYTNDPALSQAALKRLRAVSPTPISFDVSTTGDARKRAVDALWNAPVPTTSPAASSGR